MPLFKIRTDTGYCGTDEEFIQEFDSEADAEEFGWEQLQSGLTVEVEEVDCCEECGETTDYCECGL